MPFELGVSDDESYFTETVKEKKKKVKSVNETSTVEREREREEGNFLPLAQIRSSGEKRRRLC